MLCWRQPLLGAAVVAIVFATGVAKAQTTPDPKPIPSWDQLQDGLSQHLSKPQSVPSPAPVAAQPAKPALSTPAVRQAAAPKPPEPKKPKAKQTAQPKITPPPTAKAAVPHQPTASAILKPAPPVAAPQQNTAEKESESTIGKFFDRVTNFITAKPDPEAKQPPEDQPAPPVDAAKETATSTPPAKPRIATVAPMAVPEPPATLVPPPAPKTVIAQPAPTPRTITPPKPRPPTEWDKVQNRISNLPVISTDSAAPKPPMPARPPAAVATPSPPVVTATRTPPPVPKPTKEPGLIDGLMSRVTSIFDGKPDATGENKEPPTAPSPSPVAVSQDPPPATKEIETAGRDRSVPATSPTIEPAKGFLARGGRPLYRFFQTLRRT